MLSLILLLVTPVASTIPKPQPIVIKVPAADFYRASLKAQLAKLLIDSLIDEGKGKVDIKREDEIRRLCIRLKDAQ